MPKEIKNLSEFIKIARGDHPGMPKVKQCMVKKNKKQKVTKFKLRTKKNLITLRVDEEKKSSQIMESLKAIQSLSLQVVGEKTK